MTLVILFGPAALAAMQGIASLGQAGLGIWQLIQGNKMRKGLDRPEFEIPESQKAALGLARTLAGSQEMAGQDLAEQSLDEQLAVGAGNITDTASTSAEGLGALTNLYANRMRSQMGIAESAARDYGRRQENLTGQLSNMAGWEAQKWMYDKQKPYEEAAAAASALGQSGIQNLFGGVQSGVTGVAQQGMNQQMLDLLKQGNMGASMNQGTGTPSYWRENIDPETLAALQKILGTNALIQSTQ